MVRQFLSFTDKKWSYIAPTKIALTYWWLDNLYVNHKLSPDIGRKEINKNIRILLKLLEYNFLNTLCNSPLIK